MRIIEIDGRTGEGGGQLVRMAVCLAALTTQPIRIVNIRGNRPGPRGGGLKSQHVTAIQWLATATEAQVKGLEIGSTTLTFAPRKSPAELMQRNIKISAESGAASTLLILQAILPFLLFAGRERVSSKGVDGDNRGNEGEGENDGDAIEVEISGGTNTSFSLTYEYLDQVLLPTLQERFGVRVGRKLTTRGWSLGSVGRGNISIKIWPLRLGEKLRFQPFPVGTLSQTEAKVKSVDVSILAPAVSHEKIQRDLVQHLGGVFPDADVCFKLMEDSKADSRWNILLVAHSEDGIRWGKDVMCSLSKRTKSRDTFVELLCRKLCKELYAEVSLGGKVDGNLQDQVICFQALCDGYSSLPRAEDSADGDYAGSMGGLVSEMGQLRLSDGASLKKEKVREPFGHGSMHSQTVRWIAAEMLPGVEFYNKGDIVKGVGLTVQPPNIS